MPNFGGDKDGSKNHSDRQRSSFSNLLMVRVSRLTVILHLQKFTTCSILLVSPLDPDRAGQTTNRATP